MIKNKHLILHIGTMKTGSSSLQETLGSGRQALFKHNIYYPSIRPYNHIFSFPPIFMDDPAEAFFIRKTLKHSDDKYLKFQNYRKVWVKEFKGCKQDHFIVSAETLTQPKFRENAIGRLKEFVEQYFEQVTIIAYVRHYDQWIPSQIQQAVKNSGRPLTLREFVNHFLKCPPGISYRKSLKKWIKAFGRENIVIRPFDPKKFYKGSLISDFFQACDLPADEISIPEFRANESIGMHAVALLNQYNRTYPLFVNDTLNPDRGLARQDIPFQLYRDLEDEKFKPEIIYSPEQAKVFNKEIDFVNQFFENGYQFSHVSPGVGDTSMPTADDIPVEFFVDLVNNYNKKIETLERIIQVFKLPLILQILKKLNFLNTLLNKITGFNGLKND